MGMREYAVRRIFHLIIIYWAFLTVLFVLFRLLPGDPTTLYVPLGLTDEARRQVLERMGLNDPLYIQYVKYMAGLLHGDFGRSMVTNQPVADIIWIKFWNTVFLMIGALVIAYGGGTLIGVLLAYLRGTKLEVVGIVSSLTIRSSPIYWIGIIFLMTFVFWLGWFPSGGIKTVTRDISGFWDRYLAVDFLYHVALPLAVAALYHMIDPILVMRNSMLEVLNAEFITMKELEGISKINVLYKHAARNSIIPIVTIAAISGGKAVGGQLVLEVVFNWPGMGRAMVEAVFKNDYPVAQAAFFLMGSLVIFLNFVADLLYAYLDPRVSYN